MVLNFTLGNLHRVADSRFSDVFYYLQRYEINLKYTNIYASFFKFLLIYFPSLGKCHTFAKKLP